MLEFSCNKFILKKGGKVYMAVKHTPSNVIHSGSKGGTTGCGFNTNVESSHWTNSNSKITCEKNGCKN